MSDALDYVRNNCGIAGEDVAQMVDERDQVIDDLSRGRDELARRVVDAEMALRTKIEEYECCTEDNITLRKLLTCCEKELQLQLAKVFDLVNKLGASLRDERDAAKAQQIIITWYAEGPFDE